VKEATWPLIPEHRRRLEKENQRSKQAIRDRDQWTTDYVRPHVGVRFFTLAAFFI